MIHTYRVYVLYTYIYIYASVCVRAYLGKSCIYIYIQKLALSPLCFSPLLYKLHLKLKRRNFRKRTWGASSKCTSLWREPRARCIPASSGPVAHISSHVAHATVGSLWSLFRVDFCAVMDVLTGLLRLIASDPSSLGLELVDAISWRRWSLTPST